MSNARAAVPTIKHIDLFSGIGGFALACEWASIETICFVEIDKFCQKVLKKHWPDVPIVEDVNDVEEIKRIVANSQGGENNGRGCRNVAEAAERGEGINTASGSGNQLILTAGVPCQPASIAGQRRGREDDRWLWPQTLRVVRELRPSRCIFENVNGLLTLEDGLVFEHLCAEMEAQGYEVQSFRNYILDKGRLSNLKWERWWLNTSSSEWLAALC